MIKNPLIDSKKILQKKMVLSRRNDLTGKRKRKIEGEDISDKAMTKLDKTILIKERILLSLTVL